MGCRHGVPTEADISTSIDDAIAVVTARINGTDYVPPLTPCPGWLITSLVVIIDALLAALGDVAEVDPRFVWSTFALGLNSQRGAT